MDVLPERYLTVYASWAFIEDGGHIYPETWPTPGRCGQRLDFTVYYPKYQAVVAVECKSLGSAGRMGFFAKDAERLRDFSPFDTESSEPKPQVLRMLLAWTWKPDIATAWSTRSLRRCKLDVASRARPLIKELKTYQTDSCIVGAIRRATIL